MRCRKLPSAVKRRLALVKGGASKRGIPGCFEHNYTFLTNSYSLCATAEIYFKSYFAVAKRLLAYENRTLSSLSISDGLPTHVDGRKCPELEISFSKFYVVF
jgi:hypothetical protein